MQSDAALLQNHITRESLVRHHVVSEWLQLIDQPTALEYHFVGDRAAESESKSDGVDSFGRSWSQ